MMEAQVLSNLLPGAAFHPFCYTDQPWLRVGGDRPAWALMGPPWRPAPVPTKPPGDTDPRGQRGPSPAHTIRIYDSANSRSCPVIALEGPAGLLLRRGSFFWGRHGPLSLWGTSPPFSSINGGGPVGKVPSNAQTLWLRNCFSGSVSRNEKVSKEKTEFVFENPAVFRWLGCAPWDVQNPAGGTTARPGGWDNGRLPLGSRDTGWSEPLG